MLPKKQRIGILHYSVAPVVGGVENVIQAHAHLLVEAGYTTTILAGRGEQAALPQRSELIRMPELDSQHPKILEISRALEQGRVPDILEGVVTQISEALAPVLHSIDLLITHNVFTKHFNLPLTAALFHLLDQKEIHDCVAWCHDITWTSPNSRSKVYPAYPWNLLRTYRSDIIYVAVSQDRQKDLSDLFRCAPEQIHVIYNGVDPSELLALSDVGLALINRLDLWDSDLNLLMPVRVTQAKNIELALHVVAALKKKGIRPKLVVTGPPDPHDQMNMEYFQSLMSLREELRVIEEMRFVYESGPSSDDPFMVDLPVVGELLRVSDALFMPSHREGFGMPVVEAGLIGIPVFCADAVPAAKEIGGPDVVRFSPEANPDQVADLIVNWIENNSIFHLRRRVRQTLTWQSIFQDKILPLLEQATS